MKVGTVSATRLVDISVNEEHMPPHIGWNVNDSDIELRCISNKTGTFFHASPWMVETGLCNTT